jgi:hypothetical protein
LSSGHGENSLSGGAVLYQHGQGASAKALASPDARPAPSFIDGFEAVKQISIESIISAARGQPACTKRAQDDAGASNR